METIKEEKKAGLEQLLNSLIKRGRVPFRDEKIHSFEIIYVTGKIRNIVAKRGRGQVNKHYSIIELCSKGSGLWQFVCENGMVRLHTKHQIIIQEDDIITTYRPDFIFHDDEYYIIQSALKDESELEDFLLSNIKVDVKGD